MGEDTSITAPASETPNGTAPTGETPNPQATSETLEPNNAASLSPEDLAKELDRLKTSLKRANAEAKQFREKATELDTLKKQAEDKNLSETERLQKELSEIKARQEAEAEASFIRSVTQEAVVQAAKLGVDPTFMEAVTQFWQNVEVDDDGNATNVRALVEQIGNSLQSLRKSAPITSGGATNPPRSQSSAPPALSWEVIGKMKPDEYAARRPEIQQWIAANPHRYGSRLK